MWLMCYCQRTLTALLSQPQPCGHAEEWQWPTPPLASAMDVLGLGLEFSPWVFQVDFLIENDAEKDYLYDVLRMYHQ